MAFNIKQVYQDNYNALKEIFDGNRSKSWNKEILAQYKGYGGLKEVLLDIEKKDQWNPTTLKYYDDVKRLYDLINRELPVEKAQAMVKTIRANALSSFYTDKSISESIARVIGKHIEDRKNLSVLEPSSGQGVFIDSFKSEFSQDNVDIIGIDKDNIAAYIATKVHGVKVHASGFEQINDLERKKQFDIVTSNIPFGDIKIHDPEFLRSKNPDLKRSCNKIHNYFFAKGLNKTKEGGLLAFITSTGVMDTPTNEYLRKHLLQNAELVSAVRLPNNTFSSAGTQVCSDLIILKKREYPIQNEADLTQSESDFIKSSSIEMESEEFNLNEYFQKNPDAIIGDLAKGKFHGNRTILTVDPDHAHKGVEQIAGSLERIIDLDFSKVKKQEEKIVQQPTEREEIRAKLKDIALGMENESSFFNSITTGATEQLGVNFKLKSTRDALGLKITGENFREENRAKIKDFYNQVVKELAVDKDRTQDFKNRSISRRFSTNIKKEQVVAPKIYSKEFIEDLGLIEGNLFKDGKTIGTLKEDEKGFSLDPLDLSPTRRRRASGIIDIRDSYKRMVSLEFKELYDDSARERVNLNALYDSFVEKNGVLNSRANSSIARIDRQPFVIRALEREERGVYIKADLFHEPEIKEEIVVDNIEDAIQLSLNERGQIDLDYISTLLADQNIDFIIKEGIEKDLLYPSPVFPSDWNPIDTIDNIAAYDNVKFEWTTKDDFLSGYIENKIDAVRLTRSPYHTREYKEHLVSELGNIKPERLKFEEIDPKLGERWIDPNIYGEFLKGYFDNDSLSIIHNKEKDEYKILRTYEYITDQERSLGVNPSDSKRISGEKLFLSAMYDIAPNITKVVGEKRVPDQKAIKEFEVKADQVKEAFKNFLEEREDLKERLTNEYNLLEVQKVKREFNGDYLSFKDMQNYKLHPHQKDAISMLINNKGGIIDHVVGAGKTLVMVGAAMEMKKMGIVKKPMIIGLPANIGSIYDDFKRAYPKSKVLCPLKKDYSNPAKRLEFLQRAQNNDWDCIIMTHEQFGSIPQDITVQEKVVGEELEAAKENYRIQSEGAMLSKTQEKGMLTSIENLEVKLKGIQTNMRRDDWVDFKSMGIDKLFVDESQRFKNLNYTTRHQDVAGLGDPAGSSRALNLLMAARTLQEHHGGDKGLTFCSGTMISNSIVEMYSLMKFLRPSDLEMKGTVSFDAWAAKFANKSTEYEFTVTNQIKKKSRFRSFTKVTELSKGYNEIAHVVNHKNFKIDRPKAVNKFVDIEPTRAQSNYSSNLIQFAKTGEGSYIDEHISDSQKKAKMLLATQFSAKMSIDMRLLNPNLYGEEDGSKLPALCKNVGEHYNKFNEQKGTQLIFSDLGVPGGNSFNLYDSMKKTLNEEYGIPLDEIAFIHDSETESKKEKLFKKVNDGEVRVLIGSTGKLGTGVSVQKRITALHHLDMQWNPANFEQRNGRGIRQGNQIAKEFNNNEVDLYIYGTKKTLDSYKFNLMSTKQNFIDQIKSNTVSSRNMEEGGDGTSVNFAEYVAILSGKTELLDKMKAEKALDELKEKAIISQRLASRSKGLIKSLNEEKGKKVVNIENFQKDKVAYNKDFPVDPKTESRTIGLDKEGNPLTHKEFGKELIREANIVIESNPSSKRTHTIFEKGDFALNLRYDSVKEQWRYHIKSASDRVYSSNFGAIPLKTPESMGKLFETNFSKLDFLIEGQQKKIEDINKSIEIQEKQIEKNEAFDNSKEVRELEVEIDRLDSVLQEQESEEIPEQSNIPSSIYNYRFTEEDRNLLERGEMTQPKAFFNSETENCFIAKLNLYEGETLEFLDRTEINKITYDAYVESINTRYADNTILETQFDLISAPDSFDGYSFSDNQKELLEKGKVVVIERSGEMESVTFDSDIRDVLSVSKTKQEEVTVDNSLDNEIQIGM